MSTASFNPTAQNGDAAPAASIFFRLELVINLMGFTGLDTVTFTFSEVEERTAAIRTIRDGEGDETCKVGDTLLVVQGRYAMPRALRAWASNAAAGRPPESLEPVANRASIDLWHRAERAIHLLYWRSGYREEHNYIKRFRRFAWSFDGATWTEANASAVHLQTIPGLAGVQITAQVLSDVQELINAGAEEPLAHALFREAWSLRLFNPRSALVIGLAAAEAAMKDCIGTLVPGAKWLADNAQSPPLIRMLKEYLPLLPTRGKVEGMVLPPPASMLAQVENGVALRNLISHGRQGSVKSTTVEEFLRAVADLLYMLDIYCGYEWAAENLSVETVQALKEASKQG